MDAEGVLPPCVEDDLVKLAFNWLCLSESLACFRSLFLRWIP